jgi:hypothetical protein
MGLGGTATQLYCGMQSPAALLWPVPPYRPLPGLASEVMLTNMSIAFLRLVAWTVPVWPGRRAAASPAPAAPAPRACHRGNACVVARSVRPWCES